MADYSERSFICLVTASLIQSGLPPADNTDTTSLFTSISITPSLLLLPSICSSTSSATRAEITKRDRRCENILRFEAKLLRAGSRLTAAGFPRAFTQSSASGTVLARPPRPGLPRRLTRVLKTNHKVVGSRQTGMSACDADVKRPPRCSRQVLEL